MATEADVRTVLDRVVHPTFGLSLIALNMVRAVRVSADSDRTGALHRMWSIW